MKNSFRLLFSFGAVAVAGYFSYNVAHNHVNYSISSKNAVSAYDGRMDDFSDIRIDGDVSRYVFNKTGIDLRDDEFFNGFSSRVLAVKDKKELEEVIVSYIKNYIEYFNSRLDCENVEVLVGEDKEGVITYCDEVLGMDPDASVVFGKLLDTLNVLLEDSDLYSLDEFKELVIKEIVASRTYEVVTINERQLTLRPIDYSNQKFNF